MSEIKKASELLEDVYQGDMERASGVLLSKAIPFVEKLETDLEKLKTENAKLREGLRHYATDTYMKEQLTVPYWQIGEHARKILKEVGGE